MNNVVTIPCVENCFSFLCWQCLHCKPKTRTSLLPTRHCSFVPIRCLGHLWIYHGLRETKDPKYLAFVQKVADAYLSRLPKDGIPYWDFDDPNIPNAPRDASAAAVTASALLELSGFVKNDKRYKVAALKMLHSLRSKAYCAGNSKSAFLLHSTGNKPNHSEIDCAIVYADYYYIEALLRLRDNF